MSLSGTASGGGPSRRRGDSAAGEDRGAAAEDGQTSRRSPPSAARSTGGAGAWAWRSRRAPSPPRASRPSSWARPRWRSASASTASRAATARPPRRRPRSPNDWWSPWSATFYERGDRVLAFVNGMGGTPLLELYVVFGEVARILAGHGITIERSLVGSYITSLEMAGCSITLLKLDDELVRLGMRQCGPMRCDGVTVAADVVTVAEFEAWVRRFADLIAQHRTELTDLDPPSATPTTASTWTGVCGRWRPSSTPSRGPSSTSCSSWSG